MDAKYSSALRLFPPYQTAVQQLLPTVDSVHARLTVQVTAPVLFTYVWYVLQEAERMGLKRLYFLARDGYVLHQIALEIAKVCPVGLELRYLYCSRAALRMPTYHRMEQTEAMQLLLHRGTNLTINHILDRASLTAEERLSLYPDLGTTLEEADLPLTEPAFAALCDTLRYHAGFYQLVLAHSKAAYETAMPYFIQEGLTDGTRFGVVDSGWTGSMQRSLRQFSEEIPSMTGFYFGMFARPRSVMDGVYNTWYFSAESKIALRTKFNNNLFECMCAAPHGMTVGYKKDNDTHYIPVLKETPIPSTMEAAIDTQVQLCTKFANCCASEISYQAFSYERMHRITRLLLQAMMYRPSAAEAEAFASFQFCDDVTESYTNSLVRPHGAAAIREHLLLTRILRKLKGKKPSEELFWSYGTLAVSGLHLQSIRRFSLRCWDIARCLIDMRKL